MVSLQETQEICNSITNSPNTTSSKEFWNLVRSFQSNMKCSTIGQVKSHSGSVLTDNISKQMSSTPILLIYVQLWLILTDHQLGTFRLNQSITFTEIPLSTLQFFTVNIVYIVSSITSKWEKPVALIKSLAKN